MDLAPDFDEFIGCLTAHGVEFIVVGAYALALHGAPRFTGDLDVLIRPTLDNATRLLRFLPTALPNELEILTLPAARLIRRHRGVGFDDGGSETRNPVKRTRRWCHRGEIATTEAVSVPGTERTFASVRVCR